MAIVQQGRPPTWFPLLAYIISKTVGNESVFLPSRFKLKYSIALSYFQYFQ